MPHRSGIGRGRACPARLLTFCFAAAAALAEEGILRPTDKSVIKAGPLSVVASGTGELRLDGKTVTVSRPAAGVVTAHVNPSPGMHELTLGPKKTQFFMGPNPPQGWKEFRPHPPAAACDSCHTAASGTWAIKGDLAGENCFRCHDQKVFPKPHQHNSEVLAECQLCHNPHGSTEKFHLKMAKETACKQCHG